MSDEVAYNALINVFLNRYLDHNMVGVHTELLLADKGTARDILR